MFNSDIVVDFSPKSVIAEEGNNTFEVCLRIKSGTIAEGLQILVNYKLEGYSKYAKLY